MSVDLRRAALRPATLVALGLVLAGATRARAQVTLEDLRDAIRDSARSSRFPAFLSAFIGLNCETELSGARLKTQEDQPTRFGILTYPYTREFGADSQRWRFEAALGYSTTSIDVDDLYGGGAPGFETAVESEFRVLGAVLGAGPVFELGERWELVTMLHLGVAHVQNSTDYAGSGAVFSAAIADGILFNWDATYGIGGGSALLRRDALRWGPVDVSSHLRFDARRTFALATDDAAQDDDVSTYWAVARVACAGDLGRFVLGEAVRWETSLGYKELIGESSDLLGFANYFELGGGLHAPIGDGSGWPPAIGLTAAWIIGPDVAGWSAGLSLSL